MRWHCLRDEVASRRIRSAEDRGGIAAAERFVAARLLDTSDTRYIHMAAGQHDEVYIYN